MKGVSFGILTPQMSRHYNELLRTWVEAETCGFESAWLVDHLIPYDYPDRPISDTMLECWITLAALARDTEKIRLGPLVSCNMFRPPQLLAKMAASLDCISGGRLNFAIGGGWLKTEHEAYGYGFPTTRLRIERLDEAIDVITRLWIDEKASYIGKYYTVKQAVSYPKPMQRPHPPIYVGAEHQMMVKFAAARADVWNFPSDISAYTPKQYSERVGIFEDACDAMGRDPSLIRRSWLGIAVLGKSEKEVLKRAFSVKPKPLTKEQVNNEIVGTADTCIQKLGEYVDLGVSEFLLIFPEPYTIDLLQEFSREVISGLCS